MTKEIKKINVLVTGVGGDIGWNIIRCLMDTPYNLDIFGCDTDHYAAGRKIVKKFFDAPKVSDKEKYFNFIKNIIKNYKIKYIFPSSEIEINFFNNNRENFKDIIFINNSFIINTFLDKYKTINFLKQNNLSYPKTFLIKDYKNQFDFPLLIKSKKGWGGKNLIMINNSDEFNYYKNKVSDESIVQEYIGNKDEEYTIGVFSDGNNVKSICFRRYLGYGSLSKFVELIYNNEIKLLIEKIAKACRLKGSINVQLRKSNDNNYVPFEINPRISSTVYFRHYLGFKDVEWWLNLKENKKIDYIPKYKKGIGVRNVGEVFFDLKN